MKFKDKVVIVTGSGQGIGQIYVKSLASQGASVVVADINENNANKVAEEIASRGYEALALKVDVSDQANTTQMVEKTIQRYGKIDGLINNAAMFSTLKRKPIEELSVSEWDQTMAVNVRGVFLCCQAVVPHMKRQQSGRIINISSGTIFLGMPNFTHYIASKAAVIGITRALARELGDFNITVNSITPNTIQTEIPREGPSEEQKKSFLQNQCIKRPQHSEDLVGTIFFLLSDDSTYITGQTINVDGGLVLL